MVLLAVAIGGGIVMVAPATAVTQAAGDEELLRGLAYDDALVDVEDLAKVPSFKPPISFFVDESAPLVAGEALPTFCGGEAVDVLAGYEESLSGSGTPGYDGVNVSVSFVVAAIDSPKAWLTQVEREIAKCRDPYASGNLTLVPAAKQPVLKYKPKLSAALATTSKASGNSVFQIAVRTKARYFVGYYTIVAEKGELAMTDKDLDALAALANKPIFEMEQLLKQARAVAGER